MPVKSSICDEQMHETDFGRHPTNWAVSFTNKVVVCESERERESVGSNMNFMSDREREGVEYEREMDFFLHCCTCGNYGQVSKWPSYTQCMQEFMNDFTEKSLKENNRSAQILLNPMRRK